MQTPCSERARYLGSPWMSILFFIQMILAWGARSESWEGCGPGMKPRKATLRLRQRSGKILHLTLGEARTLQESCVPAGVEVVSQGLSERGGF